MKKKEESRKEDEGEQRGEKVRAKILSGWIGTYSGW